MADLEKDIYSLIFTDDPMGGGFWFGMFVCIFQGSIVWLVFYDLIDWGSDTNPMRIPPGNDLAVSIAQALLMILMSQDSMDLMEGLEFLTDGYHPEVLELAPHATFAKWLLAGVSHLIVGALIAIVIFVLLMQETTVFGLGVDFVAMNKFFAVIDNNAFKIGSRGVFSPQVREACKNAGKVKIRKNPQYTWTRRFRDGLLVVGVMTGYGVFKARQLNGDYICDSMYVEVGDVYNPGIGEVSGMFDTLSGLTETHDGRAIYVERETGQFRLAYCEAKKRWTMTPYLNEVFEPCGSDEVEVLAQSGTDEGYDILATQNSWTVLSVRHATGFNPFQQFSMTCNECSKECKPENGRCDARENCVCNDGHYGLNCEFKDPCSMVMPNIQGRGFPPFIEGGVEHDVPYRFAMLTFEDGGNATAHLKGSLQVKHRPVWFNQTKNAAYMILFSGRRWLLYGYPLYVATKQDYVETITRSNFSMVDTKYSPIYASSPVDIGTPANGPTPDSVDWFYATRKFDGEPFVQGDDDDTPVSYRTTWWVEDNQPVSTKLQCAYCDDELNPCKNYGICGDDRQCTCFKEVGSLCEYEIKCTDISNTDPSQSFGCPYNATCGRDGKCLCPPGYSGNRCQVNATCTAGVSLFNDTPVEDCMNGGTCDATTGMCACEDPFNGPLCQLS